MRRLSLLGSLAAGLLAVCVVVTPLFADIDVEGDFDYVSAVSVTESLGNTYTTVPIIISINNKGLLDANYLHITNYAGTDYYDNNIFPLTGYPFFTVDDKTITLLDIDPNSIQNLSYAFGQSGEYNTNTIFTAGYGGYVTLPNTTYFNAIETDSWSVNLGSAYTKLKLSGEDGNLYFKDGAFTIEVSALDVVATITSTNAPFTTVLTVPLPAGFDDYIYTIQLSYNSYVAPYNQYLIVNWYDSVDFSYVANDADSHTGALTIGTNSNESVFFSDAVSGLISDPDEVGVLFTLDNGLIATNQVIYCPVPTALIEGDDIGCVDNSTPEETPPDATIHWGTNPVGVSVVVGGAHKTPLSVPNDLALGGETPGILGGTDGLSNTSGTTTGSFLDPIIAAFISADPSNSLTADTIWWGIYLITLLFSFGASYAAFQKLFVSAAAATIVTIPFTIAWAVIPLIVLVLLVAFLIGVFLMEIRQTV